MKGRIQKLGSVRPFAFNTFCWACVIIYVTFSSDRSRGAAVLLLINATHFPYLPSVTTIILPTSLRSLMLRRKIFSVRLPFLCFLSLCCSFSLLCPIVIQFQQVAKLFLLFIQSARSFF